jgi:crotonobetainyl-CoA:carnitine CoA-transferase CaiB-like acyl-CoA transferase
VARPLDGIRVLDFTRVLAGPHATRMLCDLGADVIKVEPPAGDLTRFATPKVNGLSTYFVQQNAGKRNISIDLGSAAGGDLARRLADHCDVVIENYRPGVMARLGLDHGTLIERNPRLVYASISGYGSTGSWRNRRAYASVVGAEAGVTKMQGDARGGDYATDPFSHADVYTSLEVTVAILSALLERQRTGRGRWIDVSMAQTMLYVNEHLHDQLYDGEVDPSWIRSFGTSDYLVLEIASGEQMAVSGHPAERGTFELFAKALGLDDLLDDPRLATVPGRMEHLDELRDRIRAAAATIRDSAEFEARFAANQLAVGTVRSARDLADSEWASERGAIAEVSDRRGGTIRIPNAPWRFDDVPATIQGEPRYRGEDNRAVLRELLGYDDEAINALEADGVISSRIPAP